MSHKEVLMLKEEEKALVNLHIRLSDQLNRLKVEELALISMLRLQNRSASSSVSNITEVSQDSKAPVKKEIEKELSTLDEKYQEALDLSVQQAMLSDGVEEEEEEEEEEVETEADQLTAFLDELSERNNK